MPNSFRAVVSAIICCLICTTATARLLPLEILRQQPVYRLPGAKLRHNEKALEASEVRNRQVYRIRIAPEDWSSDTLPFTAKQYPNLQELDFIDCCFFPYNIEAFKRLQVLQFYAASDTYCQGSACHQFKSLPRGLYQLKHLVEIVGTLPSECRLEEELADFPNLKSFVTGPMNLYHIPGRWYMRRDLRLDFVPLDTVEIYAYELLNETYVRRPRKALQVLYSDGSQMFTGNLERGKPVGDWTFWHSNGQASQVRHYNQDGVPVGDWYVFSGEGDTLLHEQFVDGSLVSVVFELELSDETTLRYFRSGDEPGTNQHVSKYEVNSWRCQNDSLIETASTVQSELDSQRTVVTYYDKRGAMFKSASLLNGVPHGPTVYENANGKAIRTERYHHGVLIEPED